MRITKEEMKYAGKLIDNRNWTDQELALLVQANKLVIAYLQERGPEWELAYKPLMHELRSLEGFAAKKEAINYCNDDENTTLYWEELEVEAAT